MNEQSPFVVVLTGRKYSGKDTFASSIFPLGFTRLSFSDQLKRITNNIFPFVSLDYPQVDKDTKLFNNGTLSPRDIWLKMNVVTEIDKNILVRSLEREMVEFNSSGRTLFCITDLRKPEEYQWVQAMGYPIIKIIDGVRSNDVVEDELENFIDEIQETHRITNNKDQRSIDNFVDLVSTIMKMNGVGIETK